MTARMMRSSTPLWKWISAFAILTEQVPGELLAGAAGRLGEEIGCKVTGTIVNGFIVGMKSTSQIK
ncbi:hypothetical protein [Sporosarcina sp. P37]|uniref:hypothetical protein n=1 Tax=Sporosarcina sp. P37 TaxID=1930546 RepID=UPI0012F4FEB6|nr:hypothetical protein [Sporosarcina sp. P37]